MHIYGVGKDMSEEHGRNGAEEAFGCLGTGHCMNKLTRISVHFETVFMIDISSLVYVYDHAVRAMILQSLPLEQ